MNRSSIEPPELTRVLRYGIHGDDVKEVQRILKEQGFFTGSIGGNFLDQTKAGVVNFQHSHIGRDGNPLAVDGEVFLETWWALHNPSGSAQRNFVKTTRVVEPDDTGDSAGLRAEVLRFLLALHAKGVREVPDGSNEGDGVTPIIQACGFTHGIPWCMALQSYAEKECFGEGPFGKMHVGCMGFWREAEQWGRAFPKADYRPIPGDIGIYQYRDHSGRPTGSGHAVRVLRISGDGMKFNSIEGNAGNRLKVGIRSISESTLLGFVNLFHDEKYPPKFQTGLLEAPEVALSLGQTR